MQPTPLPLENRTIALAEGRQLEELVQMLEKEGARTVRCPMLSILDAPDDAPVVAWLDQLGKDQFAWVILLTGEGLRRLLACAARHALRDATLAALSRTRFAVRGPKPVKALKEVGLAPTLVAQTPTTEGMIASLRSENLHGLTVGVQLYSDSNPPLTRFLQEAGARAVTVQPYIYAAASDAERVADLIEQLATGRLDSIVFTSSPQVDRLFEVAQERGLTEQLQQGLARTQVASVGPVLSESLERHGVRVTICPEQGFVMKNLVQLLKRTLGPANEV
jgi:uroporphyrinogen-III synthase